MSQILFKNSLFELLAWNAGPDFWFKLIQIEASSLLGPPPSGQKYVEGSLRGGG